MSTRREALEAAFTAEEDPNTAATAAVSVSEPVETVEVAPEVVQDAPERNRDAAGRFAPKQPDPAAVVDVPAELVVETKPRPAAPQSWKAEHRAKWESLDPEIAAYINQREEETARGVEPLKAVWKEVQPYVDQIRSRGMTPEYVLNDLLRTYNTLANGDAQTKRQTLLNVAQAVGVNLFEQTEQQYVDPHIAALQQQVQGIGQTMMTWQQQQEAAARQQMDNEIERFKASHEHFERLAPTMGRLITAGEAQDLDTAYTKAMRLHDDIWQQQQASQRQAEEARRREEADRAAKAARAQTVSTRTATPGNVAARAGVATTGRRAVLEEAFNEFTASRI